jgi:hypothetical protein
MIVERYRRDYPGEFLVTRTVFRGGQKIQEREWIDNPIINQHISGNAVLIAGGESKSVFDYTKLARHRGGLLGRKKLQTYGTHDVYKHMTLNFYYTNTTEYLDDMLKSKYQESTVVYSRSQKCIKYPGEFFIVPQDPLVSDIATIAYLAAFDGHKEIFIIGADQYRYHPVSQETQDLEKIIRSYPGIKWYMVSDWSSVAEKLLLIDNVTKLSYRDFVTTCDI